MDGPEQNEGAPPPRSLPRRPSSVGRERLRERARWLMAGAVLAGGVAFAVAFRLEPSAARACLVWMAPDMSGLSAGSATPSLDSFYERGVTAELSGGDLLEEVYRVSRFAFAPEHLRRTASLHVEGAARTVEIEARSPDPEAAVRIAAVYAQVVEARLRAHWTRWVGQGRELLLERCRALEARVVQCQSEMRGWLTRQPGDLADVDWQTLAKDLRDLETRRTALETLLEANRARLAILARDLRSRGSELATQRRALQEALMTFTEEHPKVQALRETVARLQREEAARADAGESSSARLDVAPIASPEATELRAQIAAQEKELEGIARQEQARRAGLAVSGEAGMELQRLEASLKVLKEQRARLIEQVEKTRFLEESAASANRLLEAPRLETVSRWPKWRMGLLWGGASALLALLGGAGTVLASSARSRRMASARHLEAVTGLHVLSVLGDLANWDPRRRQVWALQAFSRLRENARQDSGRALAFGVASSMPGEGKTTWIDLMAMAARQEGFRVVCWMGPADGRGGNLLGAAPPPPPAPAPASPLEAAAAGRPSLLVPASSPDSSGRASPSSEQAICVAEPAEQWHTATRFQDALAQWRDQERVVIFVELPPCSEPEGVLLAERLPNLLWVSDTVIANEEETRMQVSILKSCRCHFVGAVLNRAAASANASLLCLWLALLGVDGGRHAGRVRRGVPRASRPGIVRRRLGQAGALAGTSHSRPRGRARLHVVRTAGHGAPRGRHRAGRDVELPAGARRPGRGVDRRRASRPTRQDPCQVLRGPAGDRHPTHLPEQALLSPGRRGPARSLHPGSAHDRD